MRYNDDSDTMSTKKPAKAPRKGRTSKRFSLVPEAAQRKMHAALTALASNGAGDVSGAAVAEMAAALAMGARDAVILANGSGGAYIAQSAPQLVRAADIRAALLTAVEKLIESPTCTALLCPGEVETDSVNELREALRFAARHKLPLLFLIGNRLTPGRKQQFDFRTLYAEFGVPVFSVDGGDAIAAYRVTTEALHNARHQRGPSLIEAVTVVGKQTVQIPPLQLLGLYMERHGVRA